MTIYLVYDSEGDLFEVVTDRTLAIKLAAKFKSEVTSIGVGAIMQHCEEEKEIDFTN